MSSTPKHNQTIFSNILLWGFLLGVFVFAYFPAWKSLILAWSRSDDYSHGFFIIPISLYIVWQKRDIISKIDPLPSNWGIGIIFLSLALYIFSYFAEITTLVSFSILPFVSGIVIYLYGFSVFNTLIFPIFFLVFMIPVPEQIYASLTIPLQLLVSQVSVFIATIIGMPIYRDGNVIHLPEQTLQVVQACSGLRSLMSLLTLSVVYGYFTLNSIVLRSTLFAFAVPVAIFVNIIRVFSMIIGFHYLNYDLTEGTVHTGFGMAIFFLALAITILIGKILSKWDNSAIPE